MEKLTLRPYQVKDIDFMVQQRRVLNANEPGLGKTVETLSAMQRLNATGALIVAPKIATGVWRDEAKKWFGWDSVIMGGTPKQRKEQRREFVESKAHILITNFALLEEVLEFSKVWNTIIVDEAHLGGLLNSKTKKFKVMKKFESTNMYLLTGTPIRRGPQDLWSLLHLLNPKKFPSYWSYVNRYCHVVDSGFGKEILGRPKEPERFRQLLSSYMVRNLKANVLDDLPPKQRQTMQLELEGEQSRMYAELLEEMMLELPEDFLVTPNRMTQDLRLRQLLVCPRLLGIDNDGIALSTMVEYLIPKELDAGRAVAVATPFRQAIPHIKASIEKHLENVTVDEIHGQIKENANDVAKRFQQRPGPRKILIYTIKSGASWTAHSASTGFMLGYEWDPNDCIQAEDRIHRIGQENKVHWHYLLHKGTVDEAVLSKLEEKANASGWILRPAEMRAKLEAIRAANRKKYFK